MRSCLMVLVGLYTLSALASELKIGVIAAHTMPLAKIEGNELLEGLVKDSGQALAKELNLKPRFLILPRKRVEMALQAGDIDLQCHLARSFLTQPDLVDWTSPLFRNRVIVVGHADSPPVAELDGLDGQVVGSVLGYSYFELDKRVATGRIKRDDAPGVEHNYKKLLAKRLPYIVVNEVEHEYTLKAGNIQNQFNPKRVVVHEFEVLCARSRKSNVSLPQLEAAVQSLVKQGEPQRWLARYR